MDSYKLYDLYCIYFNFFAFLLYYWVRYFLDEFYFCKIKLVIRMKFELIIFFSLIVLILCHIQYSCKLLHENGKNTNVVG